MNAIGRICFASAVGVGVGVPAVKLTYDCVKSNIKPQKTDEIPAQTQYESIPLIKEYFGL